VEIEADSATVLRTEAGKLAEELPRDRLSHACPYLPCKRRLYARGVHDWPRSPGARRARRDAAGGRSRDAARRPPLSRLAPQPTVQPGPAAWRARGGRHRVPPRGGARRPPERRAGRGAVRLPARGRLPELRRAEGDGRLAGGAHPSARSPAPVLHVR